MLDTLERDGVRATFFLTGEFIERHQALFRRIAEQHELANHSYTHADFTKLTEKQVRGELENTERLANQHGFTTKPYWRAPSGARNGSVLQWAADAG